MKSQNSPVEKTPPKTKDELWSVICHLRDFTLPQITSSEGVPLRTIRRHIASFVKSGHLSEKKDGFFKRYNVVGNDQRRPDVDLNGVQKPVNGRSRMWAGMKAAKTFDYRDVSLFAEVPKEAARSYCLALKKAGYIAVVRPAESNSKPELYRFVKNTGFHAPQITHDKSIKDPNLGRIVWPKSEGQ